MKLLQTDIATSSVLFAIVVVFIWSFIPFIGYGVAKLLNANGKIGNYYLFAIGLSIGLIENALYFFDILTKKQSYIGTLIIFCLFFMVAYITINKALDAKWKRNSTQ